jgi:SAM-dependent methyltransferase
MPRPWTAPSEVNRSFAYVYDVLYAGDPRFLQAQVAFLSAVFGPPPRALLDTGCGTGIHLLALSNAGYTVVGVDNDPLMLRAALRKAAGPRLVLADLRRLPFGQSFAGALCLESPLAYLLQYADLVAALKRMRGVLCNEGKLVIDSYDYPGYLGTRGIKAYRSRFETDRMTVLVLESHRYQKKSRIWTMRQQFEVQESADASKFAVVHRLRIWTMDEYAQALEAAGFTVLQALTAYPGAPEMLRHDRRLILVARR